MYNFHLIENFLVVFVNNYLFTLFWALYNQSQLGLVFCTIALVAGKLIMWDGGIDDTNGDIDVLLNCRHCHVMRSITHDADNLASAS